MDIDGDECVTVEVTMPIELLRDMDRFAIQHAYEDHSAVVRDALSARNTARRSES